MDNQLLKWGQFMTRVVAFYYDKEDFKDEISMLKHSAQYLSNRYNLRIGVVTDKKLIQLIKK